LSAFSPEFVRIRTLRIMRGTPLDLQCQNGEFELPGPHEALRELRVLIENLNCAGTRVLSDHMQNYWDIHGSLPADKPLMLAEIRQALTVDEGRLARPFDGRL
jgi:hypothetical protein